MPISQQQNNESPASTTDENDLYKLNKGLLVLNIQKEMEEPEYSVMDGITKARGVIQRQQEYCSDLERVIGETNGSQTF